MKHGGSACAFYQTKRWTFKRSREFAQRPTGPLPTQFALRAIAITSLWCSHRCCRWWRRESQLRTAKRVAVVLLVDGDDLRQHLATVSKWKMKGFCAEPCATWLMSNMQNEHAHRLRSPATTVKDHRQCVSLLHAATWSRSGCAARNTRWRRSAIHSNPGQAGMTWSDRARM